jgi:hypothetical protein
MKVRHLLLAVVSVLLLGTGAQAQEQAPPTRQLSHVHSLSLIKGEEHPELIPDATAARHFLIDLTVPANVSLEQAKFQASRLAGYGFSPGEQTTIASHLAALGLNSIKSSPTTTAEQLSLTHRVSQLTPSFSIHKLMTL